MKLKTLKDLERKWKKENRQPCLYAMDKLKAEAVKWVKELRECSDFDKLQDLNLDGTDEDWIQHFFNLTESDLIELKGGED